MPTIPKSLLVMLAHKWRPTDEHGEGTAFEPIFAEPGRARDPSFYLAREGQAPPMDMLSFDEVTGLLRDGVLNAATAAVMQWPSGQNYTATNEHAQHAIYDFCQAVYAAWHELQQRLALIERANPRCPNSGQDECTQGQKPLVTH